MRHKLTLLVATLFLFFISYGQEALQTLDAWSSKNPIQKVYLHLDRQTYYSGQTIWFKAYFLSDYVPSFGNTTLYAELLNNQSTVIQRKVFPAYMSETHGQFDLPDTLSSGSYQIRAYTPLMLNQPGFFYAQRFTLYGKTPKQRNTLPRSKALTINFFPEGGNLITGLLNNIAFKAVDENGLPINITGRIINNKGDIITELATAHDGMGIFTMVPIAGESYYATINNNTEKINLPASTINGVVFGVVDSKKGKYFKIEQLEGNENFKVAYMIGQMQNKLLFKQDFAPGKNVYNGVIQKENLPSGILHLTLFNKIGLPLAERLTFINNKEYILPATFTTDTLNIDERSRNHYSIQLKDTIIGNFSVSVTDADFEDADSRPQNIYSWFLLNSDIKGYIHNPAYYFSSDEDSVARFLDLVMMTNGWTRFKWTEIINNQLPPILYKDPGYISLAGKINIEGTKKPFANKDLMVWFKPVDTTYQGSMQFMHTDSVGSFKMDSLIFFEKANILFSDIKGKKSKYIKVKMSADSLYKKYALPPINIPHKDSISEEVESKMKDAYADYMKAEGLMLNNVTVVGRQKSHLQELDEKYASSLFSGGINSKVLDLTNEPATGLNIFDYLQGRIAGLNISRDSEGYNLTYRGGGFGGNNVKLYLDEVPTDADMIESIPVSEIAYVKLLDNFVGSPGSGTALAIYMKKGGELLASMDASSDIIQYNGYSIIKEFYNPDYDQDRSDNKPDNRLTLLWNPNIRLSHVSPKIPVVFYNNDRAKRFKIVAEGLTYDGRMLMIEKIIEPGK